MLVIERRDGESVQIGSAVVTVVSSRKGRAKLGIEADASVDIVRGRKAEHEAPAVGTAVNGNDTEPAESGTESRGTDDGESVREGRARSVTTNAVGAELSRRTYAADGSGT